jgi:hypothetical protein
MFGPAWSYDEFKRTNASAGIEVTPSDYARCRRQMKRATAPAGSTKYTKAHGTVFATHKQGITHWSVLPPSKY